MINAKWAILGTLAIVVASGCQSMDTHISRGPGEVPFHQHPKHNWWHYKFVYHPKQQVYFEPYTRTYYWFADGQWEQGTVLPGSITLDSADAEPVHLRFERPYVQHLTVLRAAWPYNTPLPGSLDDFHFTEEGIAMTELRSLERAGLAPEAPAGMLGPFEATEMATETSEVFDAFDPTEAMFEEPMEMFTTVDPILETGSVDQP